MDQSYFAYGSNLLIDQMSARCGVLAIQHPPTISRLEGHRLVFEHLETDGPAYANVVSPGDGVFGVVYRCSSADLEKLDQFEQGYERQPVTVLDMQGQSIQAVAYIVERSREVRLGCPSPEYLAKIIKGARQQGLSESYINVVLAIASSALCK